MGSAESDARFAVLPVVSIGVVFALAEFLPAFAESYGYFLDEFYYLACARRPAFGYVDHPPLAPLILRANVAIFGDSIAALRWLPALAGGSTVVLTGWMAHRMGGRAFAQTIAALCVAVAPIPVILFSFFSMNCFEVLLWTTVAWLMLELCRDGDQRLWLAIGVLLGLGFENKHTTVLLAGAVGVALLATPLRRHLLGRWLWLGALAGLLLALPNVLWQLSNGWPSLEFYRNLERESNIWTSPLEIFVDQLFSMNPLTAPVWLAGGVLLFSPRGRRDRALGWLFLTLLLTFVFSGLSRPDRIAGAYPAVFAAGGVAWEVLCRRPWLRWARIALPLGMLAVAALLAPVTFAFPPEIMERHPVSQLENDSRREVGRERIPLPFAHRRGSAALVEEVARIHAALTPQERRDAILLADGFAAAGALELHGRAYRLPPVYSPHNSYYTWGPPPDAPLVIAVAVDEVWLEASFASVETAAVVECEYCMGWRQRVPIQIARAPAKSLAELWPALRRIGLPGRKLRMLEAAAAD